MTVSVEQLVGELRDAYADGAWGPVVARHLADPVAIHHFPEEASDGPSDAKGVADALTHDQTDKLAYLLTDFSRTAESVVIEGDTVVAQVIISGNLPEGTSIRAPLTTVFTVADGSIVRIDNNADNP